MRRSRLSLTVSTWIVTMATACAPRPQAPIEQITSTEDDVTAIRALAEEWSSAVEAGDVAGVLATYPDDAVRMPPDAAPYSGRQVFNEYFTGIFDTFVVGVVWPVEGTEEIAVANGWAYHLGEYILTITPRAGGETIEEHGTAVEICRRQPDGSWRFAREIWNRNNPVSG